MLEMDFFPFPLLRTERLLLRALTDEDIPAMYEQRADPRVMRYIGKPLAQSIEDAAALVRLNQSALQANEGISWAITQQGSPTMIGVIGYWRIAKEHHRAEVGYTLAPNHWGKGFMHEALTVVLEHGFGALRLHSVQAITDPRNTASMRVLERCGFVREGNFRQDYFFNGEFLDSAVYSLLCPAARITSAESR